MNLSNLCNRRSLKAAGPRPYYRAASVSAPALQRYASHHFDCFLRLRRISTEPKQARS